MTDCDEIVIVMNNLSIKKTNTIAVNVTNAASMICHCKKVKDYYILHAVLSVIILVSIIRIICCHYEKQKGIIWNGT